MSLLRPDDHPGAPGEKDTADPECFGDLHLDKIVDTLLAGRDRYHLRAWFQHPPTDAATVAHRQDVASDLARAELRRPTELFAAAMDEVRTGIERSRRFSHPHQSRRCALDATARYCEAVSSLAAALGDAEPASSGLSSFAGYLADYVAEPGFSQMSTDAYRLQEDIGRVRYSLNITPNRIRVEHPPSDVDLGAAVSSTFARFRRGEPPRRRPRRVGPEELDHISGQILDAVAKLFPAVFSEVSSFVDRYKDFVAEPVARFDREAQFYLCYLERVDALAERGLAFSRPEMCTERPDEKVRGGFDLALALASEREVVTNDFELSGPERIIVVTGPNDGGKTTFARAFGQLHHLAALGLPVPAAEARVVHADRVLTHFEREEHMVDLQGKLADDIERVRRILASATASSVIVTNEVFSSTTLDDARLLGERAIAAISRLGAVGVYVTFVDELASLGPSTVSMVVGVERDDPTQRTFKLERRPPDGKAYARSLAERYGLDYDTLRAKLSSLPGLAR